MTHKMNQIFKYLKLKKIISKIINKIMLIKLTKIQLIFKTKI